MARPALDDEDEKPLDPAVERVRRKLVRFVAINLGLLFVALMAVVAAVVYKSRTEAPEAAIQGPGGVAQGDIPLPSGGRIVSQSLSGNRLALEVELSGGGRAILVYDLAEARIVGRYAVTAETPGQ